MSTIEHLQDQIENLVREHLAAQRAAATAAVERAFASAPTTARGPRRAPGRRRPPGDVADLAEQLFDAVRVHPGELMTVIAAHVGQTPRALSRPMHHKKAAGRVRSAGQRHLTRYFPMTSSKSA